MVGHILYSVGETDLDSVVRVLKIKCHCHRSSRSTRANIENPAKNEASQAHFVDNRITVGALQNLLKALPRKKNKA